MNLSSKLRTSYDEAAAVFARFDPALQVPTVSPAYLLIDCERDPELQPVFWLYQEADAVFYYGFHLAEIPGTRYRDIQAPYPYSGPVCNTQDAAFLRRAWQEYANWCRSHGVAVEFARFHPLLRNWDFYEGEVIVERATVWIDLAIPDLLASYETRARTAVRKALKNGVTVEWRTGGDSANLFFRLYSDAMCELSADAFYLFSEAYFHRLLEWERARLAVCISGGEPIAAAIFLFGPEVAEYHLSAASRVGKRLGATNLLLHTAAQVAQAEGCRKLYLGGGTDARPDNPLLFFKAGFSMARAEFRIGKRVHSKDAYCFLQKRFAEAHKAHPGRVLFYR